MPPLFERNRKMKKLSLDMTWELCLKMWKWIAEKRAAGKCRNIPTNLCKEIWLYRHNFRNGDTVCDCFFCTYADYGVHCDDYCEYCPEKKKNKEFDCMDEKYDCEDEPIKFYEELVRLNKIRKKKVKK